MTSGLAAFTGTARRRRIANRLNGSRLNGPRRRRLPMLRVLWRQHRIALSALLTLSAVAVGALVVSGIYYRGLGVQAWRWEWQGYGPKYPDLAMQAIPLLGGLYVGVQLIARELEDGTAGFAWTQGYGKARWVLGKLAAAAMVLVPAAVALGLVFGWWYRLYVPMTGYFGMYAFALYAPALAGWTIAGLTLGMAAAALTRREGRAMWLTIAGWIALHHFAILGSPRTPAGDFWPLQFAQLAILLAVSGLLTGGTIMAIQGTPAIPGMPRLLRALPGRAVPDTQALATRLERRRPMGVPRAAWRQHRTGLLVGLSLLGIYVATLLITGLHIHPEPARLRPQYASLTGPSQSGGPNDGSYLVPLLLPFLIGAFAGAGLTGRDLEQDTIRFACAQGVTRTRWVAGKLAGVGFVLVAAAVGAGLVFQWWDQPYLAERLADPWFALCAPVYAGWMALTFTAGAFLGTLMGRRTAGAIACLFGTLVVAVVNALFLRNDYLPTTVAINRPAQPGSLLVNYDLLHGQGVPDAIAYRVVQNFDSTAGWTAIEQALTRHDATSILVYQPASQFWQLQAMESTGLLALALLFGVAAVWVIRRQEY
jgi:ABC-type transport system involved in multi-copper enzyme maturation permease subunit